MPDSAVQITDRTGNVVGAAEMLDVMHCQLIRHTACVVLHDEKGRYLLQERSSTVPNYPGHWDMSAGGHIDVGEAPQQAAYRELGEELGLQNIPLEHWTSTYFSSEGDGRVYRYFAHIYTGLCHNADRITMKDDEVARVGFYLRSEVARLDLVTPLTRYVVGRV